MKKKTLLLLLVIGVLLVSCKPGSQQPPKPNPVTINSPTWFLNKPGAFGHYVKYRNKIKCITTNQNNQPVNYQGSPIVDYVNPGTDFTLLNKTYYLNQPTGAAFITLEVEVETQECGTYVPNTTNGEGYIGYDYFSPVHEYPINVIIPSSEFQIMFTNPC